MSIDKLKTKFFTGAWLTDVKHYFSKINEIIDYLNGNSGNGSYKVYTASLTQSGTSDPIVNVSSNTIGTINIIRNNVGNYSIVSSNLFTTNKTHVFHKSLVSDDINYKMNSYITSTSIIDFSTFDTTTLADNVLVYPESIEIRVYN